MKLTNILIILLVLVSVSCSKDDDSPAEGGDNNDGYITFYTKSSFGSCGDIVVSLNGKEVGTLSDSLTSDPACQTSTASGVLTVGVEVNAHDYEATDNCGQKWSGRIIINKGDCKLKELSR